jgi:hypothetical protein
LATKTTLMSVSVLIEEGTDEAARAGWRATAEDEVKKAVLAAVAVLLRHRPDARVEWASSMSMPLDGKSWFGRCAVCNRWVWDCEARAEVGADGVSRGAKVDGRFRCDEHLPHGHPLCFAGCGYDGPVPDAEPGVPPDCGGMT